MNTLTGDQIHRFAEHGYLVVAGLVEALDLERVEAEVDHLLADSPPPQGHLGHHFSWRRSGQSPALFHLLHRPGGILDTARELVGSARLDVAFDQAQVTLNVGPYPRRPGRPHLDGYARG